MGYDDEPYLRFLPSRVVEVNTRSPSKYANEDRYALRPVPAERRLQGAAQVAAGVPRRQLPLVRPPHPPDGEGHAAAGEGREQAHEDLRLGRSDDRRRSSTAKALGTLEWVPASSSGTSPLLFVGLGAARAADRRRGARARAAPARRPARERRRPEAGGGSLVRRLRVALLPGAAGRCWPCPPGRRRTPCSRAPSRSRARRRSSCPSRSSSSSASRSRAASARSACSTATGGASTPATSSTRAATGPSSRRSSSRGSARAATPPPTA